MSALDALVSELNGALAEEYRDLKSSLSDIKRRAVEYETILGKKIKSRHRHFSNCCKILQAPRMMRSYH